MSELNSADNKAYDDQLEGHELGLKATHFNTDGSADNKAFEGHEFGQKSIDPERGTHNSVPYSLKDEEDGNRKKSILSFYDPYLRRNLEHPTTTNETLTHLLKGSIGTGILAMPGAFSNAGLAVGFFFTFFIGIIAFHSVHLLVKTSKELCSRKRVPALQYAEIAGAAFETGGPKLEKWANFVQNFVNWFLFAYQIGTVCVYILFISSNFQQVGAYYAGEGAFGVRMYMIFITIPLILISLIPNLKYLAPFSLGATVVMACGLCIIFYYIFEELPFEERDAAVDFARFPFFFGTVVFALECIGVIMPLENNMKNPKAFKEWNGVLNTSMVVIVSLYTGVGFFGYLKYGDSAEGSITLNLPNGEIPAQLVKIALSLAIFINYALQFYVAIEILNPFLVKLWPEYGEKKWPEMIVRAILVLITVVCAAAIPYLDLFISLIGAMCLSILGFLLPVIVCMITFGKEEYGRYYWKLIKNIFIIFFAFLGFVTGTYVSLRDIIIAISNGEES